MDADEFFATVQPGNRFRMVAHVEPLTPCQIWLDYGYKATRRRSQT